MKRMLEIWDDAQKDAIKILGKDAALPYWPADLKTMVDGFNKIQDGVEAATKELLEWCQDHSDARKDFADGLSKLTVTSAKADFGLDSKSKNDATKIKDARKIFTDAIGAMRKRSETVVKQNHIDLEKAFKSIK